MKVNLDEKESDADWIKAVGKDVKLSEITKKKPPEPPAEPEKKP